MTDMLETLETRRSSPAIALGEPGPSAAELDRILTIAARVPDHGKLAPWRFIVIDGAARAEFGDRLVALMKAAAADLGESKIAAAGAIFSQAPVTVVVVSRAAPHAKIPEWEQKLSAGAVCMNLTLAATALGYGAQWLTGWAAYNPRALDLLGLKGDEKVAGFIHIGTPGERWPDRPRPALDEVVTRWSA